MSEIPVMKCPECGAPMEYQGGPSDSNIFIMRCTATGCRYQKTCYAENPPWHIKQLTPEELGALLPLIADKDTSQDSSGWSPGNPLWGHCAVATVKAWELFGGKMLRVSLEDVPAFRFMGSHYYNELPDGSVWDFTRSQFGDLYPNLPEPAERTREYVLYDPRTGEPREIFSRYKLLAFRLARALYKGSRLFDDPIYQKCFYAALDSPCQKMKFGCVITHNGGVVYEGCNKIIEPLKALCEPKCIRLSISSRNESMLGACGHAEEGLWEVIHSGVPIHECDLYVAGIYPNGLPWPKKQEEFTCLRCAVCMHNAKIRTVYVPVADRWEGMTTKKALETALAYATGEKRV